jgi:hypothetical protein
MPILCNKDIKVPIYHPSYWSNPGQFSEVLAVMSEYGDGSVQMILKLLLLADPVWRDCRHQLPIVWIAGRVRVAQLLYNIGESIMLPANQDISRARVSLDDISNALGIIPIARGIDGQAKVESKRLDSG